VGGEAVQDRDPDVEFGNLPVEVARHEALTEELDGHCQIDVAARAG
jgi:hypothetical protein